MFESVLRIRDLVHYTFAGLRLEAGDERQFSAPQDLARELFVRCGGLQEKIKLAGEDIAQRMGGARIAGDPGNEEQP